MAGSQARGENQLTSAQELVGLGDVDDVDPADRPVEVLLPGKHLRQRSPEHW
jgi:hypothetical protein